MKPILQLAFLVLCTSALFMEVSGETLVVDLQKDIPEWLNVVCGYTADYADLWTVGCAAQPDDPNPTAQGYWTQCNAPSCYIEVDARLGLLDISSISIKSFIDKNSQIKITKQKYPSTEAEDVVTISAPGGADSRKFFTTEIPLENHSYLETGLIHLTLTTGTESGIILIDSISVVFDDPNYNTMPPGAGSASGVAPTTFLVFSFLYGVYMMLY